MNSEKQTLTCTDCTLTDNVETTPYIAGVQCPLCGDGVLETENREETNA